MHSSIILPLYSSKKCWLKMLKPISDLARYKKKLKTPSLECNYVQQLVLKMLDRKRIAAAVVLNYLSKQKQKNFKQKVRKT